MKKQQKKKKNKKRKRLIPRDPNVIECSLKRKGGLLDRDKKSVKKKKRRDEDRRAIDEG